MPTPQIIIEPRPGAGDARPVPDAALGLEPPPPRKRRRILRGIGWLLLIGVLWCAWAGYALYDLATAVETGDAVALERRVDWVAVRQSLRDDLNTVAPGQPADALSSEASIAALIRSARFTDRGWDTAPPDNKTKDHGFEWHRIHYAFFSGSPFAFRVDIRSGSDTPKRPLVLLFKWKGDWQLSRVFLPADAFGNAAASAAPAAATAAADTGTQPKPPADAQRAVLYEEDPSDPNGKSYIGWVTWRVDKPGGPDPAVTAQVSIPGRPLGVTLTFRRNPDRTLPASHTIDVKFDVPQGSPARAVTDVAAIQMKPSEDVTGQPLAGSHVKVSDNIFLIGLSAIDIDLRQNLRLLKERPWIGIAYVYDNGSRAVLSIEKGPTGDKIMSDALERWSTAAVAEDKASKK